MPKPAWLRAASCPTETLARVEGILEGYSLRAVCEDAGCPNRMECYGRGTAAFLILGGNCTRSCAFCQVGKGKPEPVDPGEPERLARAAADLGLKHAVVTSVTRDDLPDGGASHFARAIKALRASCPGASVEVLIPDFLGSEAALATVVEAGPDVINHNVETVPRLYAAVRPQADYRRSLGVIETVEKLSASLDIGLKSKSGIMLGLGESEAEVLEVLSDLRRCGCDFITIGQYLAPSKAHVPVAEYISPELFRAYGERAREMGFSSVASFPLARSSYRAGEALEGKA
jgi:lipoyl synthase